ncbi:MAG: formylglycine-generating enzyme family protein, partial [Anaerolineae bacterium]|nr:formylglycine-generating enzyme family protein [Anaerolineae bacterium]
TGFQELQTVQAVQSAQAETEVALGLTQTEARISSDNSTAMAAMFAPTETAARLTLIALSATATPTPTPDPFNPISRNADWTPVTAVFGGVTMVLVPAGEFEMGSTEEEIDAGLAMCQAAADNNATCNRAGLEDERMGGDNTQVFSEPFWIDQTEVTRGQYQACVAAGVCSETPDNGFSTEPEQPINQVTWFQAEAYCAWREARLPTEAEWEYAARGPDRWVFPWGDTFDGTRANHCDRNCGEASWSSGYNYVNEENEDGHAVTAPVGSYPLGQSWVGALDLAGNVWEWTRSLYQPYPYDRNDGREADMGSRTDVRYTLRGGSFGSSTYLLRGAARDWLSPNIEDFNIGFRCARSYQ